MVAPVDKQWLTRYAPSPTGHTHLGHVAHMLYLWGFAEVLGADVLLRIEDHDRQRCRPQYEAAILDDLDWLGFEPSNILQQEQCNFRQSNCDVVYETVLQDLSNRNHVYRCACSRKDLQDEGLSSHEKELVYTGKCRQAKVPADTPHGLRIQWAEDAGPVSFSDGLLGEQQQQPELQCGDMLLRDRLGQWTYQFAVTVDDIRHGVNLVVRGEDLLESTGRQIRLADMLGRKERLQFLHHPLVKDVAGIKLSKRQKSPTLQDLRLQGKSHEEVLGEAAQAVGLLAVYRPLKRSEITGLVEQSHKDAPLILQENGLPTGLYQRG